LGDVKTEVPTPKSSKARRSGKLRARQPARRGLPAVGFIGAGRTGTALAWHCRRLGYPIAGVADKRPRQAWVAYGLLKLPYERLRTTEVAARSRVLFLTTPDSAIAPEYAAVRRWLLPGALVVHCAGAHGIEALGGHRDAGHEALALHPVQSFASHAQAIASLPGSTFAVEGTPAGLRFASGLVRRLRGSLVTIRGEDRPLYHAMCVFASNFLNVLGDAVEDLAGKVGLNKRDGVRTLAALPRAVLENIIESGSLASLTGPVQRGDTQTVARHVAALRGRAPQLVPLYRSLSLHLTLMAARQGLPAARVRRLRAVLREAR
jgi:predicted short-subunit dehydrogenase-like oxidoreductase (DUF2520 family)